MNPASFTLIDWWQLFTHFLMLSLLSIGGAVSTAPEMNRYLVTEKGWLNASEFSSSFALSQAAPGPNILFVALLGWHVGLYVHGITNGSGSAWGWGLFGVGVIMVAILTPSSLLTYHITRFARKNSEHLAIQAFQKGLIPVVIALMLATTWLLLPQEVTQNTLAGWLLGGLCLVTAWLSWKTKVHILWMLAVGAGLGAMGWV